MSEDPYKVLGVARDASQDAIRKAYRKLAKEAHPDLHPGDKKAEDRFKTISAAYDIIGDADKRARFDRGEIDASGTERPPQQEFYRQYADADGGARYQTSAGFDDFADLSDLFSNMFQREGGAPRRMRGQDLRYQLPVDFLEAVNGAKRRVTMPDGKTLDIAIPAGTRSGQTLRLKGKGMPGMNGGPAGDALVDVQVGAHPVFERDGDDIVVDLPIAIDEAVLGGKVAVPTITGKVNLTIPRGASSGQTLRLRGKGVPAGKNRAAGDQLVKLKIVMPAGIDDDLETFMKSWRESHAYNPRAGMKE
ncbi:DnaJ C-terminal domain-containing protein [Emcibacter sp. SYSU 3D8]|uniref:DnaJ C-terminal domain-containing protein n=1 Tax=Emcibacter sp. SYSU 3D8 TaxID=3133969 RepID=UPI0031FE89D4